MLILINTIFSRLNKNTSKETQNLTKTYLLKNQNTDNQFIKNKTTLLKK